MKPTRYAFLPAAMLLALVGARFIAPFPAHGAQITDSSSVVSAIGFPSLKPVHPDTVFTLAIQLKVREGWHVNAREGLPEYFIPLELSLGEGSQAQLVSPPLYPAGVKRSLGGVAKAFPVYEGETLLTVQVRLSASAKPGPLGIPFKIHLQACNDKLCLAPGTIQVSVPLQVGKVGEPVVPVHPELFKEALAGQTGKGDQGDPGNIISGYLLRYGFLLTFLLIFLGGLALNLTPCVYPMIPLTVSYFGAQKAERPLVILGRAAAYVVGISVTYSSLGVTAALTGKILGSTLQSPWVLGGISLLLVVLSFSMFGLYEIQAPAWLLDKVAAGNSRGALGAFVMGLVFGIVAAPCVDPFSIGLLTFVAAKADPFLGFLMFFVLSLGLGFPYLWLGFFSSNLQKLPRSGMWMVWVKKVFGLVLFGMPLYFLNPLFPKGFNHVVVTAYLFACGILLGWIFSGTGVGFGFRRFQRLFGAILIAASGLAYQFWPQPLELPFQDYSSNLLQEAQKDKKPVFIDFTAAWCLPCKELEVRTFPDPKVREAFQGWVLLRADLTQYSSAPVEELKKTYGIQGVPTLVFVGANGVERKASRAVGFLTAQELLKRISATTQP